MMTKEKIEKQIKVLETERDAIYSYHMNLEYPLPYDSEKVCKWMSDNTNLMNDKVDAISSAIRGLSNLKELL